MPRAYDRHQLKVDRDPLKQLNTDYGKLPKLVSPFSIEQMRQAFRNSMKLFLGIDLEDDRTFLDWLASRPFFTNLVLRIERARLLAAGRIRAGTNLVSDPDIEYPEFWGQMATEQVDDTEVEPYSGNYALKLTSLGANAVYAFFNTNSDGDIEPIKVRRGDMFVVEARAFSPVGNSTGTVQLIGRFRNSRTLATEDVVISYVQMSGAYRGQWQKLYGTVETPAGYDEFSAGIRLPADETTEGQEYFGDQFVIREATDALRLYKLSQKLARRGTNLLTDPGVDDPVFWSQPFSEQVGTDVVTPSSGEYALQVTSQGDTKTEVFFNTNFKGEVEPLDVRFGEVYAVEARVLSPSGNSDGMVEMIAHLKNSRTEATKDVVLNSRWFDASARGTWINVVGYVTVPLGYNELSVGMRLPAGDPATAGQHWFADELVLRETTAVKRLFEIARLRNRNGSNLVTDPSVDDAGFWTQESVAQVGTDVVDPHAGATALQITSRGETETDVFFNTAYDGSIDPLTVRVGDVYEVEARVLAPSTNGSGWVNLIARFENSRNNNTTDVVVDTRSFGSTNQDTWQLLRGYIKVPLGYNRLSVGVRLPAGQTESGDPYFADSFLIRESTDAKRLFDILNLRGRRGSNLVTDPGIDDSAFWTQPRSSQVDSDVVTPSSGNYALQVTSSVDSATDVFFNTAYDGSVEPLTAHFGEGYLVEARVLSPSANATTTVSLIARLHNSRTGATSDVVIGSKSFDSPARGSWQKVTGYIKIPLGYNQVSCGLSLPATATALNFYADELAIREATAAQRLFELTRLRTRRGTNLITDPTFSDEEFWTQESTAVVDYTTVVPRSGSHSLQVTSRGATATEAFFNTSYDGAVDPIKARFNETYQIECYVWSPTSNTNGSVNVVARLSNSRTGASTDVVVASKDLTATVENSWQQIGGYVRIPLGYNQISGGLVLPAGQTTTGNPFYVNDPLIRESTAAKRLFDLSKKRVRAGTNLVEDPNFDDEEFWSQESAYQDDGGTVEPRTGEHSLRIVSRGATPTTVYFNTAYDGTVEPIKARLNERYFVECYAYSPASNDPATLKLVAHLSNVKGTHNDDVVIDTQLFDSLTEGEWLRLSGYVRVPLGYNLISAGVMLDANESTAGNALYIDDALIRESTASQRIIDVLFDGFNGTTGAFGKDPDEVYGVMDVIKDGVQALKLARQRAKGGPNFVSDPRIEDSSFWTQTNAARSELYYHNGGSSLEVTCGASPTYAWWNTIDDGSVQPLATWLGDALYVQCWHYAPTQTGGGTIELVVKASNSRTGGVQEFVLKTIPVQEGGAWKKISGTFIMPEGADGFSAGVKVSATGATTYRVYFDGLVIREQTAAQRLFDVSKLRSRAGNNLVGDPTFDDAEFWVQDSVSQVGSSVIEPRTGSYSLQVTSRGATPTTAFFNTALDGTVEPIKTRFNERFFVQCYVYSPAANDAATVKLIARLANSKTGVTSDVVIGTKVFDALTEGTWQNLSGYIKVVAGYNLISAGVLLDANQSTAGNPIFVDDALIREVTGTQRLVDVLFDGFNGTTGAFGKDPDDVYGLMGNIGDGTKALKLARARAKVGPNFVNDPRIEDVGYWQQTNSSRTELYRRGGKYSLEVKAAGAGTTVWWNTIDGGTVQPISTWLDDCIYFQCFYYAPVQSGTGTIKMVVKATNSFTGAEVETVLDTISVVEDGPWKKISAVYTMPDGADGFSAGIRLESATTNYAVYLDSLLIREATQVQKTIDNLFDGLNGSDGSFGKNIADLRAASAAVRQNAAGARKLSRQRAKTGNNFVNDPRVEDADFWVQSGSVRSTAKRRSGQYSLEVTATGTTPTSVWWNTIEDGSVQPISTWPDDCVHMQCFYYADSQTGTATIKLLARTHNSDSGATSTFTVDTFTVTEGGVGWNKISGVFTVPVGWDGLSIGAEVTAAGASTFKVYFDSLSCREATASQRIVDGISQAINGGTATGNDDGEPKRALEKVWNNLWDGLAGNASSASTGKRFGDLFTIGKAARDRADLGVNAAATADGKAVVADNKARDITDAVVQAVDGSGTINSTPAQAKGKLETIWNNLWDGLQGNASSTSTGKRFGDLFTASKAARDKANLGVTNAAAADGKAVVADGKAVTADGKAVTADGKAVTAQNKADLAYSNASTADGKAVVADNKAVAADTAASLADLQARLGSSANNLVISPDFEDATVPRFKYGHTAAYTVAYSTEKALTGTQSLKLVQTNANGYALVKLANNRDGDGAVTATGVANWSQCRPGEMYYIDCSIWLSHTSDVFFNFLGKSGGSWGTMSGLTWSSISSGSWQRIKDVYTVTSTLYSALLPIVGFVNSTAGSYAYLDSIIIRLATPTEMTVTQTLTTRATGLGQNPMGIKLANPAMFKSITYRCGTADASGSSTFEIRKNGVAVSGTSSTIAAANQVAGATVTGAWYFAAGDVITVNCTGVGTTPGSGLVADLSGALLV